MSPRFAATGEGARISTNVRERSAPCPAFSLTELLITIAILALLIGLLIPTLRAARDASHATACAASIRNLQTANTLFSRDHVERFAPGGADSASANLRRWHGRRTTTASPFTPENGELAPYLEGDGAVRACPTFAPIADDLAIDGRGFERACGGYGYNNAFVGMELAPNAAGGLSMIDESVGARVGRFARPAQTIAFADCAFAESRLIEYSFAEPRFWPDAPVSAGWRADPSIHFRHAPGRSFGGDSGGDGVANIAWLDGHVSPERRTFTWTSGINPMDPAPLGLGWTGEADTNELFDYD